MLLINWVFIKKKKNVAALKAQRKNRGLLMRFFGFFKYSASVCVGEEEGGFFFIQYILTMVTRKSIAASEVVYMHNLALTSLRLIKLNCLISKPILCAHKIGILISIYGHIKLAVERCITVTILCYCTAASIYLLNFCSG